MANTMVIAQSTRNCFPIWQGFSQTWGYPQRMQAFGDWIIHAPEQDSCILESYHMAACDKADDIARFTQYYATVHTETIQSLEAFNCITLEGKEGELLRDSIELTIDWPSPIARDANLEAILNGFELYVRGGVQADNLQRLDLEIAGVSQDPEAQQVHVKLQMAIQFSCGSGDCEPLNQVVEYIITPHVLMLEGQGFRSTRATYGSGRSWEKHDTTALPPMARVALLGDAHYQAATVGIRGIHIQLDRAHGMLAWDSRVLPLTYQDGLLMTGVGIAYRQNDSDMYEAYRKVNRARHKLPAKCALKPKPGSMIWEMDVVMLQFEAAKIEPGSRSGKIEWVKDQKQMDGAARSAVEIK